MTLSPDVARRSTLGFVLLLRRPSARLARATVIGPGVTPDVMLEGPAPPGPLRQAPRSAGKPAPAGALLRPRSRRLPAPMSACPKCGEPLQPAADVCRHCLHVLDQEAWQQHDAGRLGADDRGGGRPIEDPPIGAIPLTGGGVAGTGFGGIGAALAALGNGLCLDHVLLARRRRGT